jgi:hypothetical protein
LAGGKQQRQQQRQKDCHAIVSAAHKNSPFANLYFHFAFTLPSP